MTADDPVSQAEAIVRARWTATRLAAALGGELSDEPPPPGSPVAELEKLAARYRAGELTEAEFHQAARDLLSGPDEH